MPKTGFMLYPPQRYPDWETFADDPAVLADLGYDGVELGIGDPAVLQTGRLERALASRGLHLCGIRTGAAYVRDGLCLSSTDAQARAAAVERLPAHVDLAARFGSVVVIGLMGGLRNDEPDRG